MRLILLYALTLLLSFTTFLSISIAQKTVVQENSQQPPIGNDRPKIDLSEIVNATPKEKDYSSNNVYVPGGLDENTKNLTINNLEDIENLRTENRKQKIIKTGEQIATSTLDIFYILSLIAGFLVLIGIILKKTPSAKSDDI